MGLKKLNLATCASMDGGTIANEFDLLLERAENDVRSRPDVDKVREVTLKITLKPTRFDPEKGFVDVSMQAVVKDKLPPHDSTAYAMRATADGLLFSEFAPENPDQMTIDEARKKPNLKEVPRG
jgi:hypothetical protein